DAGEEPGVQPVGIGPEQLQVRAKQSARLLVDHEGDRSWSHGRYHHVPWAQPDRVERLRAREAAGRLAAGDHVARGQDGVTGSVGGDVETPALLTDEHHPLL